MVNCAHYGNGTAITNAVHIGTIAATGSVFNNAAGGDFSLNSLPGRGAALRHAGAVAIWGGRTFPRGLTTAYPDIGAAQSRIAWGTVTMHGGMDG